MIIKLLISKISDTKCYYRSIKISTKENFQGVTIQDDFLFKLYLNWNIRKYNNSETIFYISCSFDPISLEKQTLFAKMTKGKTIMLVFIIAFNLSHSFEG